MKECLENIQEIYMVQLQIWNILQKEIIAHLI